MSLRVKFTKLALDLRESCPDASDAILRILAEEPNTPFLPREDARRFREWALSHEYTVHDIGDIPMSNHAYHARQGWNACKRVIHQDVRELVCACVDEITRSSITSMPMKVGLMKALKYDTLEQVELWMRQTRLQFLVTVKRFIGEAQ